MIYGTHMIASYYSLLEMFFNEFDIAENNALCLLCIKTRGTQFTIVIFHYGLMHCRDASMVFFAYMAV